MRTKRVALEIKMRWDYQGYKVSNKERKFTIEFWLKINNYIHVFGCLCGNARGSLAPQVHGTYIGAPKCCDLIDDHTDLTFYKLLRATIL